MSISLYNFKAKTLMNLSFTNTLIIWAGIITLLALSVFPDLYIFGMNRYFYLQSQYHIWGVQFFSSQLLHGSILHLAFNVLFIWYFWNAVERLIWYKKMLLFFVLNALFLWVLITFLSPANTVWMSWFAMAVLAYYTLQLYSIRHPEYTWWITALVINIAIGFMPGISLLWHLWGAIFWAVFWYWHMYYKKWW